MIGFKSFLFVSIAILICTTTNLFAKTGQEICQEILDNLKTAKGLPLNQAPFIRLEDGLPDSNFRIAMFSPTEKVITVEQESFNVCFDSLGVDAMNGLAFIIAHELGHYLKGHKVRNRFIKKFQSQDLEQNAFAGIIDSMRIVPRSKLDLLLNVYKEQSSKYLIMKNEAEADLEAGFLCYRAGYHSKTAGARAWEANYNKFGMDQTGGNYPSLKERMELSHEVGERLESLIRIFELGNYSMITDDLRTAAICFKHVAQEFESKELLNNLGVLVLKEVLAGHDAIFGLKDFMHYHFPIKMELSKSPRNQLDLIPIPEIGGGGLPRMTLEAWVGRLQSAIEYFDRSLLYDHNYLNAMHNKSIAHVMISIFYSTFHDSPGSFGFGANGGREDLTDFHDGISLPSIDQLDIAEAYALSIKTPYFERIKDLGNLSDTYLLLAIINNEKGDVILRNTYIKKARELDPNNYFIPLNEIAFKKTEPPNRGDTMDIQTPRSNCFYPELLIGDFKMDSLNSRVDWDVSDSTSFRAAGALNESTYIFQFSNIDDCASYQFTNLRNGKVISDRSTFQKMEEPNHKTKCDVGKGDALNKVLETYGNPFSQISNIDGILMFYILEADLENLYQKAKYNGIIFQLDSNQNVDSWILTQRLSKYDF